MRVERGFECREWVGAAGVSRLRTARVRAARSAKASALPTDSTIAAWFFGASPPAMYRPPSCSTAERGCEDAAQQERSFTNAIMF